MHVQVRAAAGLADRAHDVGAESPPVNAVAREADQIVANGLVALDPLERREPVKALGDRG